MTKKKEEEKLFEKTSEWKKLENYSRRRHELPTYN